MYNILTKYSNILILSLRYFIEAEAEQQLFFRGATPLNPSDLNASKRSRVKFYGSELNESEQSSLYSIHLKQRKAKVQQKVS